MTSNSNRTNVSFAVKCRPTEKAVAFINDTPASLAQMKMLGEKLIDVHSQHQNLLLNKEGFQLNILDILAQDEQALSAYQSVYLSYKKVAKELGDFIAQAEKRPSG